MARKAWLIALSVGVCSILSPAAAVPAAVVTVTVTANPEPAFVPQYVTIQAGDTIKWVAPMEPNSQIHNITSDDDFFFSGFPTPPPFEYSFKFDNAGTYPYYCTPHGNKAGIGQSGVIFVRPARTANEIVYEKSAWDFHAVTPGTATGDGPEELMRFISGGGGNELRAGLQIPAGSKITGLEITGCDDSDVEDFKADLLQCPDPAADCNPIATVESTGNPGCTFFATTLADGPTVNNLVNTYGLVIQLGDGSNVRFRNVRVFYKRVVSAAPLAATFGDVPTTHQFYRAIEALAASGVTQGCGTGNFCPDDPVTRAAMASFLARALGLFFPN